MEIWFQGMKTNKVDLKVCSWTLFGDSFFSHHSPNQPQHIYSLLCEIIITLSVINQEEENAAWQGSGSIKVIDKKALG